MPRVVRFCVAFFVYCALCCVVLCGVVVFRVLCGCFMWYCYLLCGVVLYGGLFYVLKIFMW